MAQQAAVCCTNVFKNNQDTVKEKFNDKYIELINLLEKSKTAGNVK